MPALDWARAPCSARRCWANGGDLRLVGAATGALMGASIGYSLGATRAAAMRLQAIAVLGRTPER